MLIYVNGSGRDSNNIEIVNGDGRVPENLVIPHINILYKVC